MPFRPTARHSTLRRRRPPLLLLWFSEHTSLVRFHFPVCSFPIRRAPCSGGGEGSILLTALSLSQGLKLALELGGPANAADSAHAPSCRELSLLSATPGQAEPGASRRRPLDPCPPHPAVRGAERPLSSLELHLGVRSSPFPHQKPLSTCIVFTLTTIQMCF